MTPHVARNDARAGGSAIDGRTTRWAGYAISQRTRKRIEQVFGWGKTIGRIWQVMCRGRERAVVPADVGGLQPHARRKRHRSESRRGNDIELARIKETQHQIAPPNWPSNSW